MKNSELSEKDRATRSKIRMQITRLREKLKDLEEGVQSGASKQSDVDVCKGEMEVLRKELQSLVDGGHTTFIKAKTMLEPKKNLSSKEKKLDWKTKLLKTRLTSAEKKLKQEGNSEAFINKQSKVIDDLRAQIQSLAGERQAIENFNHTRFVELKSLPSEGETQSKELLEVEGKIKSIKEKLARGSNLKAGEEESLKDELHLLEMEKESIENFTHDHFLENLESMKAKRKSALR
ncbi:hypothetical protein OAV71_01065 [Opitutales bacterium]|jgi:DNA repair exonuclease SbcCD ATPase subunit|nr:hypothetical protein [Opitutales bacterium]